MARGIQIRIHKRDNVSLRLAASWWRLFWLRLRIIAHG